MQIRGEQKHCTKHNFLTLRVLEITFLSLFNKIDKIEEILFRGVKIL